MDTVILHAAYKVAQNRAKTLRWVCSKCHQESLHLYAAYDYLKPYLKSIGLYGDIMLCQKCLVEVDLARRSM